MQKSITNDTFAPMFVNGTMIPPGETRVFTDDEIPPEHREEAPPPVEEAPPDRVAEIAEMKADLIVSTLADFNDEDLARLLSIEEAGKKRKTVLTAIGEEQLKRAAQQLEAGTAAPEGRGE